VLWAAFLGVILEQNANDSIASSPPPRPLSRSSSTSRLVLRLRSPLPLKSILVLLWKKGIELAPALILHWVGVAVVDDGLAEALVLPNRLRYPLKIGIKMGNLENGYSD